MQTLEELDKIWKLHYRASPNLIKFPSIINICHVMRELVSPFVADEKPHYGHILITLSKDIIYLSYRITSINHRSGPFNDDRAKIYSVLEDREFQITGVYLAEHNDPHLSPKHRVTIGATSIVCTVKNSAFLGKLANDIIMLKLTEEDSTPLTYEWNYGGKHGL
jgi:hypothetical protein